MSIDQLPWTNVILATTELHATLRKETLQWHTEGSTIYIVMENRPEMDLRMDWEVFDVQVCLIYGNVP
jgi:hypothetical protein